MKKITRVVTASIAILILMGASLNAASDLSVDNLTVNNDAQIVGTLSIGPYAGAFPSNGVVLHYDFNTNTTLVPDLSGFGRTGTVFGATWVTNGITGGAFSFDGVNNYIDVGRMTALEGATNYTISLWAKLALTNATGVRLILSYDRNNSCGSSDYPDTYFFWYSDGVLLRFGATTWSTGDLPVNMADNGWHHIVLVRVNNTIVGYDNGAVSVTFGISDYIAGGSDFKLRLCHHMNASAFSGLLDEVVVFNKALSLSEVVSLRNYYISPSAGGKLIVPTMSVSNSINQVSSSATNIFMGKVGVGSAGVAADSLMQVGGKLQVDGDLKVQGTNTVGAMSLGGQTRTNWPAGGETWAQYPAISDVNAVGRVLTAAAVTASNRLTQLNPAGTNFFMGSMGIGTNTPAARLHVNGNMIVESNLTVKGIITANGAGITNIQGAAIVGGVGGSATNAIPRAGARYVVVAEGASDTNRGTQLLAAYAQAMGMVPTAISNVTVIVPPGAYNLGTNVLSLSVPYVNVSGLVRAWKQPKGSNFKCSQRIIGTITQTAHNVQFSDLDVSAYTPNSGVTNTVIERVRFGAMATSITYTQTFVSCVSGANSFGSGANGVASGTFIDCAAGNGSFGYFGPACGTFKDCTGGDSCFGSYGNASGLFTGCTGVSSCFGASGTASGIFKDCTCILGCFSAGGIVSGMFTDCNGGWACFGGGGTNGYVDATALFNQCTFGPDYGPVLNGKVRMCHDSGGNLVDNDLATQINMLNIIPYGDLSMGGFN